MTLTELYTTISESFSTEIYRMDTKNHNELYLNVNPMKIKEICVYLNGKLGYSLVSLFALDERDLTGNYSIYYTFAVKQSGQLVVLSTTINPSDNSFLSISTKVHAAALYEREIKDLFGLVPLGHPDAKRLVFHGNWPERKFPLRKDFPLDHRPDFITGESKFNTILGEGVFEVPVGPVHAGIIEPGHFRFSLAGEPILNLEAQLYYVHKGIEKICEGVSIERGFYLSERISGDETFTNSLAYCQAIEKIAGIKVPDRGEYTRVLFAELERLTSHLGDLAGICMDVAYGFAGFQFRMLRGWSYRLADDLCGMRFLRSVNKLGGIRRDFVAGKEKNVIQQLQNIKKELEDTFDIIIHNSMFIDRVENTGILKTIVALDLNAVGPAARASGIAQDVRKSFPYAAYQALEFQVPVLSDGDVSSRVKIKISECFQSINLMIQVIEKMPSGKFFEEIGSLESYRSAFGMTEAPRGENVHFIMTGENNTIFRYKIRTPSFCNWPALCHAVQGNIIPDFPLINKSFNLSYAGNDL